ncbi:MAG: polymer-forming cytoskeletal protein [Chloroflexi bacterium]|nr:polymer-forming cytoskeletal protein [Chloroflexota bacterium]
MFGRKKEELAIPREDKKETVLAGNDTFEGILKAEGTVKIYGTLTGQVEAPVGTVMVGKEARVEANINAQDAGIMGIVMGNITASGRVEIFTGAEVHGDIVAPPSAVRIDLGATFDGRILVKSGEMESEVSLFEM